MGGEPTQAEAAESCLGGQMKEAESCIGDRKMVLIQTTDVIH